MARPATREALLHRLRENEKINSHRLKSRGFIGETRTYRCSECGLFEALIFWTPAGRPATRKTATGRTLKFRCPNECRTEIRFDLQAGEIAKTNRGSTVILANWLLLSFLGLGLYAWSANTVSGQAFVSRAWETSQNRFYELGLVLPGR